MYKTISKQKDETKCEGENCSEKAPCEGDACEEETGAIEDILYPLYIPSNTYLSSSDKVATDVGDRVILTFGGEKNFVLVEEKAVMAEEFEIIPVYGDPLIVNDTIGALGTNSLTWTKDNISYYLAGNDLRFAYNLLEICYYATDNKSITIETVKMIHNKPVRSYSRHQRKTKLFHLSN